MRADPTDIETATFAGLPATVGHGRGEVGIAGIGAGAWLATREGAGNAFPESLQSLLGHCASISDQSDAYVILKLTGSRVRETLAKPIPIDIHARSFHVRKSRRRSAAT